MDGNQYKIQGVPKQVDKSKVLKLNQNLHFLDSLYVQADHKKWLFDYSFQDSQKFHEDIEHEELTFSGKIAKNHSFVVEIMPILTKK